MLFSLHIASRFKLSYHDPFPSVPLKILVSLVGFMEKGLGLVPQVQMEPLASWSAQALAVINDPTSRASVNPWVLLAKSGVGPDPRRGH